MQQVLTVCARSAKRQKAICERCIYSFCCIATQGKWVKISKCAFAMSVSWGGRDKTGRSVSDAGAQERRQKGPRDARNSFWPWDKSWYRHPRHFSNQINLSQWGAWIFHAWPIRRIFMVFLKWGTLILLPKLSLYSKLELKGAVECHVVPMMETSHWGTRIIIVWGVKLLASAQYTAEQG